MCWRASDDWRGRVRCQDPMNGHRGCVPQTVTKGVASQRATQQAAAGKGSETEVRSNVAAERSPLHADATAIPRLVTLRISHKQSPIGGSQEE